ncbi:unnamed protein product [Albugo candida]|nr:unnamed protein product [Albugo candida]|eukprot:CCI49022.1 unnamed protein product [Albugo candida]
MNVSSSENATTNSTTPPSQTPTSRVSAVAHMPETVLEVENAPKRGSKTKRVRWRWCIPIGSTRVLCTYTSGYIGYFPTTCHIGPDRFWMLLTYTIILAPIIIVASVTQLGETSIELACQTALAVTTFLTLILFSMTACSDPGMIFEERKNISLEVYTPGSPPVTLLTAPMESEDEPVQEMIVCASCHISRPVNASHCYDCNACILELDHHCPWTGKCIGKRTLYWFYAFLASITCHLVVAAITIAYTFL